MYQEYFEWGKTEVESAITEINELHHMWLLSKDGHTYEKYMQARTKTNKEPGSKIVSRNKGK